ncbi:acyl-CoA dehydrogenase [Epidermidibacterium keratini]|uniref:Acyl-CoA dehydrogenase n=1 Tax=Epidermidibacterium keratini TaxID=1891644 RepID=A0A7L4YPG9_9ACTN|nr:acyl-CoA dehydrogenase family protein [Epidermidibacterium keratini]QHC00793.1 acyl-CoA dehydrogenase [Epidermidibacterium keratini]
MSIRDEVREWLAGNWNPGMDRSEFRQQALGSGWLVPTWSERWFGKDLNAADAEVVGEEFERVGAPARADRNHLHARVIYELGSDELREQYLRDLLTDRVEGCLLYSEPGAGSDLASARTSAVREGDQWRVNGQKVWTSHAREADYGLLVARTNADKPKHTGITFFVLPMKQPGVEVRPITQITGDQHFNEVFLTDALVDDANRLGDVDAGWQTLMIALGYERLVMGARGVGSRASDPTYVGTGDDLIALAREHGVLDDSATAQSLADIYAARTAARLNAARYADEGRGLDPAAMSLGKLSMSAILHGTARVRRDIIGAATLLDERSDPPGEAEIANFFTLDAYFTSIGGGTDQIQRNILAERVLGLPKEADPSKSIPFREVPQ